MNNREKTNIADLLTILGLLAVTVGLVLFPQQCISAGKEGISLCLNALVPSLFPFFVVSSLIIEMGIADTLGRLTRPLMRRVFNIGGACSSAMILGFVGGYPVGAKTAISLYRARKCSRIEAERMLSFCNNSGPAFILGVVGAGVFMDSRVGLLLYLSHILASVAVGLIFRKWGGVSVMRSASEETAFRPVTNKADILIKSIVNSFSATFNICGFVIFFSVFIKLLFLSGIIPAIAQAAAFLLRPLGVSDNTAEQFIIGVIELTSGVWSLKDAAAGLSRSAAMAAFMLGWAGLSVHFQVLSFLRDTGLTAKSYILGKLLHAVISAVIAIMVFKIFYPDALVAFALAAQIDSIADLDFRRTALISFCCAAAVLALPAALYAAGHANSSRKKNTNDI